ncbi:MAG: DNA polymerase III subunit tau [Tenericutes bacterium ADurb.BinA155]|nr:MAG: DNA polymerase III subunit tau [Tenericutes bacterium ADurb.BinA155]
MAYKALYNKYRPATFEEVAGQRSIVRTLKNAISSGKIAHAYLFCGPRGTGKTSMARLFAKALNCEKGIGQQCNVCSNCEAINEGVHPDVIEIDAASNNGVDQVRDLIDKIRYAPIKGRYKVYIIDEVHMMSAGAFNALLKTLEEPPEQVIFILATTEPYKVLPTILSRCQRFDFGKIDDEDIREKLIWILDKEKVEYDEKGIDAIIALADGGMRDALSILDQVLAYSGNQLHEADVLTLFGLTSNLQKIELLKLIRAGDVSRVLGKLEEFLNSGVDIKRLSDSLLEILKDLVIYEKTHEESLLTSISEKEALELEPLIDAAYANRMIQILIKTQIDFKSVSNIRSLFELTLLQLCTLNSESLAEPAPAVISMPKTIEKKVEPKSVPAAKPVTPASEPAPKIEPLKETVTVKNESTPPSFLFDEEAKVAPTVAPVPTPAPAAKAPEVVVPLDLSPVKNPKIEPEGEMNSLDPATVVNIMVLGNKDSRYALTKRWPELDALKAHPTFGNLASLLADGHPFCLCDEVLLLTYNFTRQRNKANVKANQAALSQMVSVLLGKKVFVYALDRNDAAQCQKDYFSLLQLNKLPDKKKIVLNLPEGE